MVQKLLVGDKDTVLLIPAYREEGRVGAVVREVKACHPGLDVVVIDDGSPDATGSEARAAGAAVLRHPFNLGYGTALVAQYFGAGEKRVQRCVRPKHTTRRPARAR